MLHRMGIFRYQRVAKALGIVLVLVGVSVAAEKATSILFPDWSGPTKGTYDKPAAELGTKATAKRPWSVQTMASSVDGKPVKGKATTLVGEIIDLSCYLQVGKHGDKHRECGQKCVQAGQPVGLLTADGSVYMLIDEEHNDRRDGLTEFRKACIENMAYIVTVNGTLTNVTGQRALYVQGYVKKQ